MKILAAEGIQFEMGVEIDVNHLPEGFDAYCICTGTPTARDLSIPGRELKGIHFALEMLAQQNRILAGQNFPERQTGECQRQKGSRDRWRRHWFRLHRNQCETGSRQCHANRNYAQTSRRSQSFYVLGRNGR